MISPCLPASTPLHACGVDDGTGHRSQSCSRSGSLRPNATGSVLESSEDGIENLLPRGAKCEGGFLPGQVTRPAGQEEHIGFGEGPFAVAPRNFFDDDGVAAAAVYAPHGVEEEDEESPEGNELESPFRRVDRTRAPADGSESRSRPNPGAAAPRSRYSCGPG